jgi:hypothetical protein
MSMTQPIEHNKHADTHCSGYSVIRALTRTAQSRA